MPSSYSSLDSNVTSSPSTRALLKELETELQTLKGNYEEVIDKLGPILTPQNPTMSAKDIRDTNETLHSEINAIILDLIERARFVKSSLYYITDRIIL